MFAFARIALVLVTAVVAAGCQTSGSEDLIWVRTDGEVGANNPRLQQQHQLDWTICLGEVQKSAAGAPLIYFSGIAGAIDAAIIQSQREKAFLDIAKGCMAERGYVLVPQSQARATSEAFRRSRS